ncbi:MULTISPECIES: hypothetical protein [unclassified Breznakia]|uniref:hypothetical protein n=1 Tax=unclassified Breznakia TaxID=2623764 RepID=UPI0024745EDF|nr:MULTISPECIES: hypothetical protein [unclassified Breznakia]MDH6367565.1 hypothetical protein [Breznakia sp. PH1-1]MDH6404641.1 hypothetical protein [Breznakia sp. PF1-11]MDH6412395.1 hypothetical protein [Breznakia sp. PFB1-11]MDH6414733.1 hypothetical protein [Breznakia sp. PFB1-14]MDH6417022.1 hypothetical protein [Breznakia sp. PFB1-4]
MAKHEVQLQVGKNKEDAYPVLEGTSWTKVAGFTNVQYKRQSGWVKINWNGNVPNSTSWTTLFTLPAGFRPTTEQYGSLTGNSAVEGGINRNVNVIVQASGSVQALNPHTAGGYIGTIVFPLG